MGRGSRQTLTISPFSDQLFMPRSSLSLPLDPGAQHGQDIAREIMATVEKTLQMTKIQIEGIGSQIKAAWFSADYKTALTWDNEKFGRQLQSLELSLAELRKESALKPVASAKDILTEAIALNDTCAEFSIKIQQVQEGNFASPPDS